MARLRCVARGWALGTMAADSWVQWRLTFGYNGGARFSSSGFSPSPLFSESSLLYGSAPRI
eukprot:1628923-Rhodomonas_salina.1